MLFYTHLLLGTIFFLLFRNYVGGNEVVFYLLVLIGSVLPDIDDEGSKVNRWFGAFGNLVAALTRHRGILHSLLFVGVVYGLIGYFWQWPYALALSLGYLAHILGDGLTLRGVKLFYPLSEWRVHGPVKTGGFMEWVVMLVLIVLVVKQLI